MPLVRPLCVQLVLLLADNSAVPLAHDAGALAVLYTSRYGAVSRPLPVSVAPAQLSVTCALPGVAVSVPLPGATLSMRTRALFVASTLPTLSVDRYRTYLWHVLPLAHVTLTAVPLVPGTHVSVVSVQYCVLATPVPAPSPAVSVTV